MIVYWILVGFSLVMFCGAWIDNYRWSHRRSHSRCLRNIDELERELFPEWFQHPLDEIYFGPGAVWRVDDPGKISWMENAPQSEVGLRLVGR